MYPEKGKKSLLPAKKKHESNGSRRKRAFSIYRDHLARKFGKCPEKNWKVGPMKMRKKARRFQTKVDSEVPGWLDEQKKLATHQRKALEEWLKKMDDELK